MNASKEGCRKACNELWNVAIALDGAGLDPEFLNNQKQRLIRVENFLRTAEQKLPTEAACEKAKKKKDR